MNVLRSVLAAASLGLLAIGYASSQWAFFRGEGSAYAERLNSPSVSWLCLALVLAAVGLAAARAEEPPRT